MTSPTDSYDHPFMAFAASESVALQNNEWDRKGGWHARAAAALGVPDLDGDEESGEDCYSMDRAYDAYERGESVEQYVATVRTKMAARK